MTQFSEQSSPQQIIEFLSSLRPDQMSEIVQARFKQLDQAKQTSWTPKQFPDNSVVTEEGEILPFNPAQKATYEADTRMVALISGPQLGKTCLSPIWMWREIQRLGRGTYLAVSNDMDMFKLKMLPVYIRLFVEHLDVARYWASDKLLEIRNPHTGEFEAQHSQDKMYARIILRSADDKGGMESSTAQAVHMDEAGQENYDLELWKATRRRIAVKRGRVLITTTLYGLSAWLQNTIINPAELGGEQQLFSFEKGEMIITRNEASGITLVQADSTLNPSFEVEEFEENRASMPDDEFQMMYRGRVTTPRDLIYDCFGLKNLCGRFDPPPHWQRVWGIDFGGVNLACVKMARNPETGVYYLYGEYHAGGRSALEHVAELMRGESNRSVMCFGGARAEESWRNEFAAAGLVVIKPPFDDLWLGIQRVYALLKKGELVIFNDLPGTLKQLKGYRRKRDRSTGESLMEVEKKATAHYLDSLRYVTVGMSEVASPDSWLSSEMKALGLIKESEENKPPVPSNAELFARLQSGKLGVDNISGRAYNILK